MSLKKEGFLLPLDLLMKWIGLDSLPKQDPEWLAGKECHPIGVNEDGKSRELRVESGGNELDIDQSGSDGPALFGKLVFNGLADGSIKPLSVLVETVIFPRGTTTGSFRRIDNPPERTVKALCQGFHLAVTNKTPIGTDANPLSRIEFGEAADDLDARMNRDNYTQALSVTRRMFSP